MVIGNLLSINFGAAMVYPSEGFDPAKALEAVTQYKGTLLYGVPTMMIAYLDELTKNKEKYNVSTLRSGFIAGSVCPEVIMKRVYNELGIQEIATGYG